MVFLGLQRDCPQPAVPTLWHGRRNTSLSNKSCSLETLNELVHTLANLKPKLSQFTSDILPRCLRSPSSSRVCDVDSPWFVRQRHSPFQGRGVAFRCGAQIPFHRTVPCACLLENSCRLSKNYICFHAYQMHKMHFSWVFLSLMG